MQLESVAAPAAVDLSYYRLSTPVAVQQVLESLQRQQAVMTLLADVPDAHAVHDAGGRPCGMAVLSQVDAEQQCLVMEVSGALLPLPAAVLVVAHLPGSVRTQWELQAQWTELSPGRWQLQAPWPNQVLQHQRRRHPRLQLPLGQRYEASFMFGQRHCVLHMDDLSQGGVALRGTRSETSMLFMGRKISKVVLDLGSGVQVQVDLTVRSRRSYKSFLLGEQVMVGCSLEGMTDEVQAALARIMQERGV
ncbi:PilZ domain-containing protein [Comamonas terrigena]|uniref:PilZ domain-containing protein n=1 Tax=Comamonas terrigena TaxID=32013 RepID=UPI0023572150|nr:PilZ domain-containing protein [Comamonas terrigena]